MGFESPSLSFEFNLALASLLAFIETPVQILTGYFIGIQMALRDNFNHAEINTFQVRCWLFRLFTKTTLCVCCLLCVHAWTLKRFSLPINAAVC